MQIKVFNDHEELSLATANEVLTLVAGKPNATLCFASGETPRRACELLAERAIAEGVDFSRVNFIGLDEWVGVPPDNEGSCKYFFQHLILNKLHPVNYHFFDAMSDHLAGECAAMDDFIKAHGPIDLMIVGIGMNGHIGFNEPGVDFELHSHVINLDETTLTVGQKYFREKTNIGMGITLGLKDLVESKRVILIANGEKKASIIHASLEGPVTPAIPASIIQSHSNAGVFIDKSAASQLKATTRE